MQDEKAAPKGGLHALGVAANQPRLCTVERDNEMEIGMQLAAVLTLAPEGGYIAYNPETQTVSQGETVEEAIENLQEAVSAYLEVFPMGSTSAPIVTMITVPEHA